MGDVSESNYISVFQLTSQSTNSCTLCSPGGATAAGAGICATGAL